MESAIELAWIMSTLLPPSSACKPTVYYQEWQELVTTSDSTVNPETDPNYKLVYCRPILFFGAEGTIGKPGAVKCLPAEPLSLQTTGDGANNGEQPPLPSHRNSSSNEYRSEEPGSSHKLAETPHKESTAFTAGKEVEFSLTFLKQLKLHLAAMFQPLMNKMTHQYLPLIWTMKVVMGLISTFKQPARAPPKKWTKVKQHNL